MKNTFQEDAPAPELLVRTIMFVDDDELVRESAADILAVFGFNVMKAVDGVDALEQYRHARGEISLIIMDITMPRMDGIEAAIKIREIDPQARIILSSGYAQMHHASVNPNAYLPKPYEPSALRKVVEKVLRLG